MTQRLALLILGFFVLVAAMSTSIEALAVRRRTEAQFCPTCNAAHAHKQGLQKMFVLRTCPDLTSIIAKYARASQVSCYESLFGYESSCSTTVIHDQKKTRNPAAGIGLCALESNDVVRLKLRARGPDCIKISTADQQVKCCVSIMHRTAGRYFGTVIDSKVTPRCY